MHKLSDLKGKKFISNFHVALKDMEKYVKDPRWLWYGRDFSNFSLRPREVWPLWLLCVVVNQVDNADFTFGETDDCDGVILDKRTGELTMVESVAAMDFPNTKLSKGEDRVIEAIMHKASKGKAYATGKALIVFMDGADRYEPNKIAKAVVNKHHFDAIYVVSLINDKGGTEYSYSVMALNDSDALISIVRIESDFSNWQLMDPSKYLR